MKYTNRAMLSRGASVIRNNTLIINLPGSVKAVKESLDIIIDPLHHGLEILKRCARLCKVMIDYSPIWISFKCAAFSIFITFFLGLFAARWMMTLKNKSFNLFLMVSLHFHSFYHQTVMGFFLLLIFGVNQPISSFFLNVFGVRIAFSFSATVIAAVVISFPIMYRSARGALEQVDTDLVDAARTLGMNETSIF